MQDPCGEILMDMYAADVYNVAYDFVRWVDTYTWMGENDTKFLEVQAGEDSTKFSKLKLVLIIPTLAFINSKWWNASRVVKYKPVNLLVQIYMPFHTPPKCFGVTSRLLNCHIMHY